VALVIIEDPADRDPNLAASLAGMYGLTASEAELAGLLADGLTPEEAADAREVRLSTVRTQIQSLLQKTDARRLTDLVRLLARTPRRPN
jgi:DNA-binding CsgD family transcriptional regulator